MGIRSGLPIVRFERVSVGVALMDVGSLPLVDVQRRMRSPGVVDESLVYL